MRKLAVLSILILVGVVLRASADPVTLSVCRDSDGIFHFDYEGDVLGWWFNNVISFDLKTRTTPDEGAEFVAIYDPGITESIFATADASDCAIQADQWQPGAIAIPIVLTSDCAFIDVQDAFGHWSRVQSNGQDVLLHWGDSLIGSQNQSTDPNNYRAIPTECF